MIFINILTIFELLIDTVYIRFLTCERIRKMI